LRSIEDIYNKAFTSDNRLGEFFMDGFNVHTGQMNLGVVGSTGASTDRIKSETYGFSSEMASQLDGLTNFSLLNMAPVDSLNELVSTHVHSYDFGEKQFSIDCKDTHILSIRKKMKQLYADKMKGSNPVPILPINPEKVDNRTLKHEFSGGSSRLSRAPAGINKVLKKALAFAPCVSFDVVGQTNRLPGKHVIMLSSYTDKDSAFGKLFVGEWLTTRIQHVFAISQNSYYNTITCVKPHTSDNIMSPDTEKQITTWYNENTRTQESLDNFEQEVLRS